MICAPCLYITLVDLLFHLGIVALEFYNKMVRYITEHGFIKAYRCPKCGAIGMCIYHCKYRRNFYYSNSNGRIINGELLPGKSYDPSVPPGEGVWVHRFLCLGCSRTHAFLPDVMVPWSMYSLPFMLQAIYDVKVGGCSLNSVAKKCRIERKTLRKWIRVFEDEFNIVKSFPACPAFQKNKISKIKDIKDFFDYLLNYNNPIIEPFKVYSVRGISIEGFSAFCSSFYEKSGHRFMQSSHVNANKVPDEEDVVEYTHRVISYHKQNGHPVSGKAPHFDNSSASSADLVDKLWFDTPKAYPWQPGWL